MGHPQIGIWLCALYTRPPPHWNVAKEKSLERKSTRMGQLFCYWTLTFFVVYICVGIKTTFVLLVTMKINCCWFDTLCTFKKKNSIVVVVDDVGISAIVVNIKSNLARTNSHITILYPLFTNQAQKICSKWTFCFAQVCKFIYEKSSMIEYWTQPIRYLFYFALYLSKLSTKQTTVVHLLFRNYYLEHRIR